MIRRISTRTGILLVTAFVGSVAIFSLLSILPGDAATVALGINATPEALAELRSSSSSTGSAESSPVTSAPPTSTAPTSDPRSPTACR
jgi:ABC-type dipeptide/oligopeptide/nickel transport system permease component